MLNVLLTIDTEVYPLLSDWRQTGLKGDIARDLDGQTVEGSFGLDYQLQLLNEYNLKAVCFVEALFASIVGPEPLRRIVDLIQKNGQEVQLHVHPEWLEHVAKSTWSKQKFYTLCEFPEAEQAEILAIALANLRAAGAKNVTAFRAGDYAANAATLHALKRIGITIDSSYNVCYPQVGFSEPGRQPLVQPAIIDGICEFPISFFSDRPGHFRHAQVTACSLSELRHALTLAWERGWSYFVIVCHSFELLMDRRSRLNRPRADSVAIRRIRGLFDFLASNRDKFQTVTFDGIDARGTNGQAKSAVLQSSVFRTACRMAEQGMRRISNQILT